MSLNPWNAKDCSALCLYYLCKPLIVLSYSYIVEKKSSQNSSKEIKELNLTEVEVKGWKNQVRCMTEQ